MRIRGAEFIWQMKDIVELGIRRYSEVYQKEDIAKSTMYEDAFVNNQIFSWMTRSRVSLDSVESQKLIGCLRMCC